MKIAATAVSMDAARTFRELEQRTLGLNQTTALADPSGQLDGFSLRLAGAFASSTQTQTSAQSVVSRIDTGAVPSAAATTSAVLAPQQVLSQLAEQVVGRPLTISDLQADQAPGLPSPAMALAAAPALEVRGLELSRSTYYHEEETLLFSAQGSVQTTDGRMIAFELGLSMERSTEALVSSSFGLSPLFIDPLILQFDAGAPLLGDSVFSFDLDGDGASEELACPGSGCGFLAFDRNQDGSINNGLELFGPASGAGFGELAELDGDGNQWIDEQDPLFDSLLIWRPDGQGGESLQTLRQAGVGAIAVVHAGTAFELQDGDGKALGKVKASGIFLTEAGEVRALHEIDLARPAADPTEGEAASALGVADSWQTLRDIVGLQRLRLQMMLTGMRLQAAGEQREEQRDWLSEWLRSRDHWQSLTVGPARDSVGGQGRGEGPGLRRTNPAARLLG